MLGSTNITLDRKNTQVEPKVIHEDIIRINITLDSKPVEVHCLRGQN